MVRKVAFEELVETVEQIPGVYGVTWYCTEDENIDENGKYIKGINMQLWMMEIWVEKTPVSKELSQAIIQAMSGDVSEFVTIRYREKYW